ncbi:hypothetical protein ACTTAM_20170 (plasmid) [Rhodobacter capsulatus]|uniref:hypothetical protein n=1 Tax=Rhodobacter capsulatus TaxID=1061 RepID=UPI0040287EE5
MGTLAYMSGDARRLYVRDGSDSFELPVGQCVPITKDFAQIINPYPRQISIVIARGLPVQFSQEVGAYTNEQSAKRCRFRMFNAMLPRQAANSRWE